MMRGYLERKQLWQIGPAFPAHFPKVMRLMSETVLGDFCNSVTDKINRTTC